MKRSDVTLDVLKFQDGEQLDYKISSKINLYSWKFFVKSVCIC